MVDVVALLSEVACVPSTSPSPRSTSTFSSPCTNLDLVPYYAEVIHVCITRPYVLAWIDLESSS